MKYLYLSGVVIVIIKLIGTFLWKGFKFTPLIAGFFRFYNTDEIDMSDPHDRFLFRKWNNIWNIIFYSWLLLFAVVKFATIHAN
jgi:hypothetical protein